VGGRESKERAVSTKCCECGPLQFTYPDNRFMSSSSKGKGKAIEGSSSTENQERIYVDNSNLSELKSTCDDAVDRVS